MTLRSTCHGRAASTRDASDGAEHVGMRPERAGRVDAPTAEATLASRDLRAAARQLDQSVTAVTSERIPRAGCWRVTLGDRRADEPSRRRRVELALQRLDGEHVAEFWGWSAIVDTAATAASLVENGVLHAVRAREPTSRGNAHHHHHTTWVTVGSGALRTSDEILEVIESSLPSPLTAPYAANTGTFRTAVTVWLDTDVDEDFLHVHPPLQGSRRDLPTRSPRLPGAEEVWILHRGTGRGWVWQHGHWSATGGSGTQGVHSSHRCGRRGGTSPSGPPR